MYLYYNFTLTTHKMSKQDDRSAELYFILEYSLHKYYDIRSHEHYKGTIDCEICTDSLNKKVVMEFPCGHCFHYMCIYKNIIGYKRYNCPSCNYQLTFSKTTAQYHNRTNGD